MCRYGTKSGVTITGVPGASAYSPCDLPPVPDPALLAPGVGWSGPSPWTPHTCFLSVQVSSQLK